MNLATSPPTALPVAVPAAVSAVSVPGVVPKHVPVVERGRLGGLPAVIADHSNPLVLSAAAFHIFCLHIRATGGFDGCCFLSLPLHA